MSLVGSRPRIFPRLGPFIPLGSAQTVGFGVQHGVQRLFHRAANYFSQVLLNLPLVNLDHLTQLRHFSLVGGLHHPSSRAFLRPLCFTNQTYSSSNVRKIAYVIFSNPV